MNDKTPSSGRSDDDLDQLLNQTQMATEQSKDVQTEYFAPKIKIRPKKKGESMRPLGSRVPTYMIEELKLLADYHDTNVEDMVAGILESVLEVSMDEVYDHKAKEMRNRRKSRTN